MACLNFTFSQLCVLPRDSRSITVDWTVFEPVNVICNFYVLFDTELPERVSHLKQTCICYNRLYCPHSVHQQLVPDVTAKLMSAFVLSCLDYCNAVLTGLPASTRTFGKNLADGSTGGAQPMPRDFGY